MHFSVLQVTIFGQSSGATSIFALLASPLCQGLFHKAWMSSASVILNKTAAEAYQDNRIFMERSGCTNATCMYALTSEEVTRAVPQDVYPYWKMSDQFNIPIKGYFDGALAIVDGKNSNYYQFLWLSLNWPLQMGKKYLTGHILKWAYVDCYCFLQQFLSHAKIIIKCFFFEVG